MGIKKKKNEIKCSGSRRRKNSLLLVGLPGVDSQVKGVGISGVRKLKLNPKGVGVTPKRSDFLKQTSK